MDFTLDKYQKIILAGLEAGYRMHSVFAWHNLDVAHREGIMIRHDVDRRPRNALAMARLEADLGVYSTYYFRIVPCAFDTAVIAQIRDLGHEIGYHYEDLHLAGGNIEKAIDLFVVHLDRLRQLAPIRSIAMHGSPLARKNNMEIWSHYDYSSHGVIDAVLSFDYSGYYFFTDSGRTFGPSGANLRDYLGNAEADPAVRSSEDLIRWLSHAPASKVQISTHPERWNQPGIAWARQWTVDLAANSTKRMLKGVRRNLT